MPKIAKWILAIFAGLIVLIVVAILVAPMLINLDRYKPQIEAEASKAVGRPVQLLGKIEPSVFPWVGLGVQDLRVGNPEGFEQKDFVSVGLFEVRVKLWPLLFGDYEIKRFVVKSPHIALIKKKDGKANWENLGGQAPTKPEPAPETPPGQKEPLSIKNLVVAEFAITDGNLLYIDQAADARHEIKDLELKLIDVSLDQPIQVDFSAKADNHPIRLSGTVGPVGADPGKGPLDLNLLAEVLATIKIRMQGRIENPTDSPKTNLTVQVAPFSLRKVMEELKQPMPIQTTDKDTFDKIELDMKLAVTSKAVSSQGVLTLDQSKMNFTTRVQEFDKPNVQLEATLDRIDVDRYLPPPSEEKPGEQKTPAPAPAAKKTDYTPLRKLVLDAQIKVNEMKVKNARTRNIVLRAKANNGVIRIDPLNLELYEGRMAIVSTINVQQQEPRTDVGLSMDSVKAGPLLKDVMKKDIIEGVLKAAISLQMTGDQGDRIRQSLNGKGELTFNEGAIVGVDLAGMVRNVQAAFGLKDQPAQKPRTDFSELAVPFTITNGVTQLNNARMQSPLLRLTADGKADLVQETLDIRVEPKFVGTIKGQGDTKERAGIMVPVLVGGTFEDPKYRPDLKAMLRQDLPSKEQLKKMVPKEEDLKKMVPKEEELKKELEKKAGDLLKGFK